jgi:hypothetical protein
MEAPAELSPRASGQLISARAEQVTILEAGVERAAGDIVGRVQRGEMVMAQMFVKTPVHPQQADSSGVDWVFLADTLNFCFWNRDSDPQYEVTYKGEKYTGYLAMCAAINRALDAGVALTSPAYFSTVPAATLGQLLEGDGGVQIPLLEERAACLREVGRVLADRWGGSFGAVLEAAAGSAPRLLELVLENFPCFRDGGLFDGVRVTFHKRAQILVADLWCLFEGCGRGGMEGIDQLTMFADYRVPQSLQHYGVFEYSPTLRAHLAAELELAPGHRWEQEIRGCSIEAVERVTSRVRALLKERGVEAEVNSVLVDQFLWGYRRHHAEAMRSVPYHRVRSIYY